MTLREILEEKELRLENVPMAFADKTEEAQKEILKRLIRNLDKLERDGGLIVISIENLSAVQEISEDLLSFIFDDTEYAEALKTFSSEFSEQARLSREYLSIIQPDFEDKKLYKQNLKQSQKQAIDLLARAGVDQAFIKPMKSILQASIASGGSFTDAVGALSDYVVGKGKKEGALLSHAKQVAFDGFAFTDRQYIKTISEDLDFEWFQYFGGKIKDSRYFCVEHSGLIVHKKEVQYWGDTPSLWDKPPGSKFHGGGRVLETNKTTIWTYAGGYNCRHQIVPVATSSVKKKDKDRAKKLGFI